MDLRKLLSSYHLLFCLCHSLLQDVQYVVCYISRVFLRLELSDEAYRVRIKVKGETQLG